MDQVKTLRVFPGRSWTGGGEGVDLREGGSLCERKVDVVFSLCTRFLMGERDLLESADLPRFLWGLWLRESLDEMPGREFSHALLKMAFIFSWNRGVLVGASESRQLSISLRGSRRFLR